MSGERAVPKIAAFNNFSNLGLILLCPMHDVVTFFLKTHKNTLRNPNAHPPISHPIQTEQITQAPSPLLFFQDTKNLTVSLTNPTSSHFGGGGRGKMNLGSSDDCSQYQHGR